MLGENAALQQELTKKELKKLTGASLIDLFKTAILYEGSVNYTGNVDIEKVASFSKEYLTISDSPTPAVPYQTPQYVPFEETKIYIINRKKSVQSQIRFTLMGSERKNADVPLIAAFNNYFDGGMSGLVFQEIREFRSLAYSAFGFYAAAPLEGKQNRFIAYIGCQSDKTNDAIMVMDSLINEMPEKPERMEGIQTSLLEKAHSSKPNFRYLIDTYKSWERKGYTEDPNKISASKYPEIQFNDIVDFQKSELKGKPMVITIVGDVSMFDLDRLKQLGEVIMIKEKDLYVN